MTPIEGQPILTAAQMRAAEAASSVDEATLMQRAGIAVGDAVHRLASAHEILVVCGPGNNGGDGYVAAARLRALGREVRVAASGEPRTEAAAAARAGSTGPVEPLAAAVPAPVLVDALFGIGLSRALGDAITGPLARLAIGAQLTIAVDVPSGVATDDGAVPSDAMWPWTDVTLALGAPKPAHVLQPAATHCGAVRVLDIGVQPVAADAEVLARPILSRPHHDDHKYSRGTVAIVAGAMPGAAALAAEAAARGGAGYVLLLGSATDRLPHAVVRRRYDPAALHDPRIGALLIGPGLGRDERARDRLAAALATAHPLVLDGDALHLLDAGALRHRAAPAILTPHAGEFAALFGDGPGGRIARARAAAEATGATIVFKGADTVIAAAGRRAIVSPSGSSWLSTAGTGDVLAGIVAARLAGGSPPVDAAAAAVWLHAEAARLAGPAFLADDLPAHLPGAIAQCL